MRKGKFSCGIFLIVVGIFYFLDKFYDFPFEYFKLWPLLIISLGIEFLVSKTDIRHIKLNFGIIIFTLAFVVGVWSFDIIRNNYEKLMIFDRDLFESTNLYEKPIAIVDDIENIEADLDNAAFYIVSSDSDEIVLKSKKQGGQIYYSIDNNTLRIWHDDSNVLKEIFICIPKGYKLKRADISNKVGRVDISDCSIDNLYIKNDVGKVVLKKVKAYETQININMGSADLKDILILNKISVDTEKGNIDYKAKLNNTHILASARFGFVKVSSSQFNIRFSHDVDKVIGDGKILLNLKTKRGNINISV